MCTGWFSVLFCHDGKMIPIANATNVTGPAGSWMGDGDGAPALLPVQHEYDPLNTDDLMYRLNNDVKCAPTTSHSSDSPVAQWARNQNLLWPLAKASRLVPSFLR